MASAAVAAGSKQSGHTAHAGDMDSLLAPADHPMVSTKMDELFFEFMCTDQARRLVRHLASLGHGKGPLTSTLPVAKSPRGAAASPFSGFTASTLDEELSVAPSPLFTSKTPLLPSSSAGALSVPSPPGSPMANAASPQRGGGGGGLLSGLMGLMGGGSAGLLPGAPPNDLSPPRSPQRTPQGSLSQDLTASHTHRSGGKHLVTALQPMAPVRIAAETGPQSHSVPRFYLPGKNVPNAKLISSLSDADELKAIDNLFASLGGVPEIYDASQIFDFCQSTLGVSKYFAEPMLRKVRELYASGADALTAPVTKAMLTKYWSGRLRLNDTVSNFFHITKEDKCDYITRSSIRPFVWHLLEAPHPGLDFLQETREFQDRYADTVVARIFFVHDRRNLNRIYYSDLRRHSPSIAHTWLELDNADDINRILSFFSYEHFYVIYCKFWELDTDHDFQLTKEDLLRYDGHAFSRKAIDRIFAEIPLAFQRGASVDAEGRKVMSYEDFAWFLMSDEDKISDQALNYFFRLVDLDGDGVIKMPEMQYFYIEQTQRLDALNQESVSLADIMCQMNDMIKPDKEGEFRLADFQRNRKSAATFFSILLSLNKFLAYEQREPFSAKQEMLEHPDWTDWDRFCSQEYFRLAMEEDDGEEDLGHTTEAQALQMDWAQMDQDIEPGPQQMDQTEGYHVPAAEPENPLLDVPFGEEDEDDY